jgi:hypothetical protein
LRDDIDYLGEQLGQTGANWTNNNFNWTKGDRYTLDSKDRLLLSYIIDMRTACTELSSTAGISAPTWTIATANLKQLYTSGVTATISGTVLTQPGGDFSNITNATDSMHIQKGTGATPGKYVISAHTSNTATLTGYSGDSATGDVEHSTLLSARLSDHTHRKGSLITDIRTAILAIVANQFTYYIDSVNGNDTTGSGTYAAPWATWGKMVTACNSTAGSVFLFNGSYATGATELAPSSSIDITGESTEGVTLDLASSSLINVPTSSTINVNTITIGDGTAQAQTINNGGASATVNFTRCILRNVGSGGRAFRFSGTASMIHNFYNCSFYADDNSSYGIFSTTTSSFDVKNCHFYDTTTAIQNALAFSATITSDYNAFENVTTKQTGGSGTFNNTNEVTVTNATVRDKGDGHLYDDADLVGATAAGNDVGAYPNGWYNVLRTASDSMAISDSSEMSLLEFADDTIIMHDDLESVTMNVSVDMFLGGLFKSSSAGVITYKAADAAEFPPVYIPNWTYNGSSLDVSFDNSTGDSCEVHIVASDGTTDYSPAAWWEINAINPAITTTQTNGTRGYGIDLYLESQTGIEWGEAGTFSTVTADGVNDQQWDITLKIRVKNTVTGVWSEVITATKTYYFNDFDKVMYYCADNPRLVADEYANHANYYSQTYHTGTAKYTRPDGVDWFDDYRRYAYSPMSKMIYYLPDNALVTGTPTSSNEYAVWQTRKVTNAGSPVYLNTPQTNLGIYAVLACNYGNYSTGTLFASPATTQVSDSGTQNFTYPVLGSATTNIRVLKLRAYEGTDCVTHSSQAGYVIYMPTDESYVRDDFSGKPAIVSPTTHKYNQEDRQFTGCSYKNGYYFHTKQNVGTTMPSGDVQWALTDQKWYVNTDLDGNLLYGEVSNRYNHTLSSQSFSANW